MNYVFPANDRVSLTLAEDGIALVTLTRAAKRNAMDSAMFTALVQAGQALFDQPGLRCVVLTGDGPSFCSGLDLATFQDALDGEALPLTQRTHGNANIYQQAALQWRKLPVPVIAAVQGVCFGAGLQIAGGADIRVVAPDARLAVMEMRWGIIPDMGGFALWRGLVRDDILRELTYTHREFSGDEAVALGFATHADADPLTRAMVIAREIAKRSPSAVAVAKALFNRAPDLTVDEILREESLSQHQLFGSRNQMEAVLAQLEGRSPIFSDR